MDSNLLKTKSIEQLVGDVEHGSKALRRSLTAWDLTLLGIGAIIGTGIFVLTGTAAANQAGPAIMMSYLAAGLACGFAALCYAEFASMIPIAGSAYTYAYATMGEVFAWIIGWDLILEYSMGAATVAVGWSGYVVSLLANVGIHFPPTLAAAPGTVAATLADGSVVHGLVNLPAAFIVLLLTGLLVLGTQESARMNNLMVAIKLAVVLAFIGAGIYFVDQANWTPFIPANTGEFGHFGWSGVLRGASVVFFAYIGFDAVSCAAQEARNCQRDMPIGILGSLIVCTILYVIVAAVITGLVPYSQLDVADPIAKAVDVIGVTWLSVLVKLGAIAGLTTVILVLLYGQSRIFFTIAKDGLLPPLFAAVHPRLGTPHRSLMMVGAIVAVVAALTPIGVLGEMVSIGTLFAFVMVCGAVLYLRRSDAHVVRPFRTPGVPFVPVAGVLLCLLLMAGLPLDTWMRLLLWLGIGLVVYFSYGRHHSVLRRAAASA